MAKNLSGRDYLVYAGTTEPTSAIDAGDANYSLVGKAMDISISRSRNAIDTSTKDDGDGSSFIAGRKNESVSISGLFDHTEDAGYTKLSDAFEASNGTVYFLVTSTNTGDTEWYGSGVITDLSTSFADESASSFTASIQVNGTITEVVGTST